LVVAVALISLAIAAQRAASPQARMGWLVALAALVSMLLAKRLGPRVLLVAGPTLAWMVWSWLGAKPTGSGRQTAEPGPRRHEAMTRQRALRVLGLQEGASSEAVAQAYRKLIKKVHPDHGGSDLLAHEVNEAKRVLDSS
jgi:hypothetical protein